MKFGIASKVRVALASLLAVCLTQAASALGLIMPIYGNTSAQFNAAVSAARQVPTIAVINPDNGPGSKKVGGISNHVSRLRGARATVAGYIDTSYGGESLASVYKQIDRYKSWYGANGIFLDEMADSSGRLGYYRSVYSYARGKGMIVVGNPGTFTPSSYYGVTNVLVTYEDPQSAGWNGHRQAGWTNSKPASRFGAVVYAAADATSVVNRAASLNYGWVFATNRGGGDPFGAAPSYMGELVAAIKAKNSK